MWEALSSPIVHLAVALHQSIPCICTVQWYSLVGATVVRFGCFCLLVLGSEVYWTLPKNPARCNEKIDIIRYCPHFLGVARPGFVAFFVVGITWWEGCCFGTTFFGFCVREESVDWIFGFAIAKRIPLQGSIANGKAGGTLKYVLFDYENEKKDQKVRILWGFWDILAKFFDET